MSDHNPLEWSLMQAIEDARGWREYAWELERIIELMHRRAVDLESDISLARARAYLRKHKHLLAG